MNILNISSVAALDTNSHVTASPSPQVIDAKDSSSGLEKIQTLRPVDSTDKTDPANKKDKTDLNALDTKELVEELNEYMDDLQTNLGFSIREELDHQVVVEIKNRKTDELVKQIPSEELLKIRESMENLTGSIFDQSV